MALPENYFTKQNLTEMLRTNVLKGSLRPPDDESMRVLLKTLNFFRLISIEMNSGFFARDRQNRLELARNVEALEKVIPSVVARLETYKRIVPATARATLNLDEGVLKQLANALEQVKARPDLVIVPEWLDTNFFTWKGMAFYLGMLFRKAMQNSNPTKKFGNSNGGPVARFVSGVMPGITGESITPETVSALLKRRPIQPGIFEKWELPG